MCFTVAMETFAVDKSFYDIDSADELKELWEADLDPVSYLSYFGTGWVFFAQVLNPVCTASGSRKSWLVTWRYFLELFSFCLF